MGVHHIGATCVVDGIRTRRSSVSPRSGKILKNVDRWN